MLVPVIVNNGDTPVKIDVTSAYGSKTFATIQPGAKVSAAFTTRLKDVPAGALQVTVTGDLDGETVTEEWAVAHEAFSC